MLSYLASTLFRFFDTWDYFKVECLGLSHETMKTEPAEFEAISTRDLLIANCLLFIFLMY